MSSPELASTVGSWTRRNAEYTDRSAARSWASTELRWGKWGIPESVEAPGESVPLPDASFDPVVSEDGASAYADPRRWIPEAATGFGIERLIELQAPATAVTHEYYSDVTAEWAQQWPDEEIWVAVKR